ncbi:hypothetical protein Pcinc_026240 [Petrolisthes cinctipes]|uniref:Uncharacterized protein n=1 Tax=Petrolisthes cinctipes TaxID=88211 RepID=A0AAE1F7L9_PETCI|nr:hypothetical protein Pcinc_026240 [Petrolisthes cinctipes]
MGDQQTEDLMQRLKSWSLQKLLSLLTLDLLSWGRVRFLEGGIAVHGEATNRLLIDVDDLDAYWIVLKVESVGGGGGVEDGSTHIQPLHLYAALNVGREGWCVLTRNLHTFTHVLLDHYISSDYLPLSQCNKNLCTSQRRPFSAASSCGCGCRCCVDVSLVPRVRACLQNINSNYPQYFTFMNKGGLVESWNILVRVHIPTLHFFASCYNSVDLTYYKTVMEEDARTFLSAISFSMMNILRLNKSSVNEFLRNFTHAIPVRWEEASDILFGEVSLTRLAFHQVRLLPLSYLQQNAPRRMYHTVLITHTIN